MDSESQLLNLEQRFWTGGADFYRDNLTDDSLMVFAEPVGALTKDRAIQAIASGPRWTDVEFHEVHVVQLTDDVAVLTYRANARREGEDSVYSALVSSVYVSRGNSWMLAFHQQTPSGEL